MCVCACVRICFSKVPGFGCLSHVGCELGLAPQVRQKKSSSASVMASSSYYVSAWVPTGASSISSSAGRASMVPFLSGSACSRADGGRCGACGSFGGRC